MTSADTPNRKRWIICADGTWNEPDQTDQGMPSPTNVSKLAAAILPYDPTGMLKQFYIMRAWVNGAA